MNVKQDAIDGLPGENGPVWFGHARCSCARAIREWSADHRRYSVRLTVKYSTGLRARSILNPAFRIRVDPTLAFRFVVDDFEIVSSSNSGFVEDRPSRR